MNQQERRKIELALRKRIKAELIFEQIRAVGYVFCMECKQKPDYADGRGELHLSHSIPLSRGGKTDKENCTLKCRRCHNKKHGIHEAEELKTYWD